MTINVPKETKMLDLLNNSIKATSLVDGKIKNIDMGYHEKVVTGMISGDLMYKLEILTHVYTCGADIVNAFNSVGIQLKTADKTKEGSGNYDVWILSAAIPQDPIYCPHQRKIV